VAGCPTGGTRDGTAAGALVKVFGQAAGLVPVQHQHALHGGDQGPPCLALFTGAGYGAPKMPCNGFRAVPSTSAFESPNVGPEPRPTSRRSARTRRSGLILLECSYDRAVRTGERVAKDQRAVAIRQPAERTLHTDFGVRQLVP